MNKIVPLIILFCTVTLAQADNLFSIDKVDIRPGEEKFVSLILINDVDAKTANIDIALPAGLSFVNEDGNENDASAVFSDRTAGMMLKSAKIQSNGALRIAIVMLMGTPVKAGKGEIIRFKVKANIDAAIGVVQFSYTGQKIMPSSGTAFTLEDKTSDVNIYDVYKVIVAANDAAMGTVTGGTDEVMSGTPLTVKATPAAGYAFVAWKDGDTQVSTDAEYTFTPTKDVTLIAIFEASTHITQHSAASSIPSDLFTLTGIRDRSQATSKSVQRLPAGLYVIRGKKVMIK